MRIIDITLLAAAAGAFFMSVEGRNRTDLTATEQVAESEFITCPLRKPDFATVMQAAFLGDGTVLLEQQIATKVRHIGDC
ncbi:MAG TPA: hypothetical protein VLA00_11755 [Xanthobacteraceae bacterium]|nr:hypothetical protein [Xanthobacteraceae bacterium]